jgi:type III pantothenate kinase
VGVVLAVDLGNTDTKFGLVADGELTRIARLRTGDIDTLRTGEDLLAATVGLADILAAHRASSGVHSVSGTADIVIGSVVSRAGARLAALLTQLGYQLRPMTSLGGLGFRIDYAHGEPGVDRVAACFEAFARAGGPLLLVGIGTAVHTNVVSADGVYQGGAIMPGIRLMSESLGAGTDQVRPVEPHLPRRVIGKSTPEGAEIGIFQAWLGGTLRLIELTRAELAVDTDVSGLRIWLTGGHSAWLEPHVPDATVVDEMALRGLARTL